MDEVKNMYYIYFLKSLKNNKYYIGRTSKLPIVRLSEHNLGSNTWTKHNSPFKLVYFEKYYCLQDGIQREKFYKSGFGKYIKKIIIEKIENLRTHSSVG